MQDLPLTYNTYLKVTNATKQILSARLRSRAYTDFNRAYAACDAYRKWEKGMSISTGENQAYMVKAILPTHSLDLSHQEFNRLYEQYGDAVIKVTLIDRSLKNWLKNAPSEERILSVGGACALEGVDTKLILALQQSGDTRIIQEYIENVFERFPSWTQITGALIPMKGVTVMYEETFPWFYRISDYGIKDAESATQRKYDNIYSGVKRYAKLCDPHNIVVKIPFTQLHLDKAGNLSSWFEDIKESLVHLQQKYNLSDISYDPNTFYKAWVEYTYFGPQILSILHKVLEKKYAHIYKEYDMQYSTIHVRGKQIDHLDTERHNLWMHDPILGVKSRSKSKDKEYLKLLQHIHSRLGTSLYVWMRDNHEKLHDIGFAGFLDTNLKGKLLHEDFIYMKGEMRQYVKKRNWEQLLDSPLRLHSTNVEEVLRFLGRFKSPHAVSFSTELLSQLTDSKNKLRKIKSKIKSLDKFIFSFQIYEKALDAYLHETEDSISVDCPKKKLVEINSMLLQRFKNDKVLQEKIYSTDNPNKKKTVEDILTELICSFSFNQTNKKMTIMVLKRDVDVSFVQTLLVLLGRYGKKDIVRQSHLEKEHREINEMLNPIYQNVSQNITEQQNDHLTKYVTILPLVDNMFVSYMQQLLFIPSVRAAYVNMAEIEQNTALSKGQKEILISQAIQNIFPVVEESIAYIMKGGDYPWKERFEYQYELVY